MWIVSSFPPLFVMRLVATPFFIRVRDWKDHVESDPALFRPSDIERSCGNAAKAHTRLGWKAEHRFTDIIRLLVESARG